MQLLAPLVVALLAATPTLPAWLFAIASGSAFLANEPWLVMLGHRGKRARELDSDRARRRLGLLIAIVAISGGAALVMAPAAARTIALLQVAPIAGLLVLAHRKQERSLVGELVAAVVLSGAAAPVAIASGMAWTEAMALWIGWSVGFGCTTFAVHHVIEHHKRARRAPVAPSRTGPMLALATATLAIGAVPLVFPAGALAATSALPLGIVASGVALLAPSPRRLRAIGFSLLGAALVSIAFALQATT